MSSSESKEKEKEIPPAAPACAILNGNLEVMSVNRAWKKLTGYFYEAVAGQSILNFLDDKTGLGLRTNVKADPELINALPIALKRNPMEFNEETVNISLTLHSLFTDSSGSACGYLAVATPVPSENAMPNLGGVWLEPSEFVGHLVRGTAHKLNNLVTVFQGYTDMLLMGGDPEPGELREALGQMSAASGGLVEIINRLLDVGSRASLDCRDTDASELTEHLFRLTSGFRRPEIELEIEVHPGLPKVFVDPKRLEQAIAELVRNACDAIEGSGTVNVETRKEGEFVTITVTDTGPGFTPEQRSLLFRPFYTTKRALGRLGIGLNAVSGLITQMNGELQARSETGKGAQFRVVLRAV